MHRLVVLSASAWRLLQSAISRIGIADLVIAVAGILLAILVRVPLLGFKSVDYFNERIQAYPLIQQQGFAALAGSASNYNPPYFYAAYLIARFLPGLPMVVAVKLPAIITDFVCAFFVYLIVRLKYPQGRLPLYAALLVLFAPTVVLNSAFWGQVDSMHTAGILASVYFLMKRQGVWAILAFAVALAFKLQAIFLVPLLLALFLRGEISWKPFLIIPAVLFVAILPASLAGRPLFSLLTVYVHQASQFESITMGAASVYTWVPGTKQFFEMLYLPALVMGAIAAFLLVAVIYKSRLRISAALLLELALLTMLVVPFFLPKMHDRYFFPADVISIAFALYDRRFFYIPLAIIGVSALSYVPFLFNVQLVPFPVLTLVMLVVICILGYDTMRQLYGPPAEAELHEAPKQVGEPA